MIGRVSIPTNLVRQNVWLVVAGLMAAQILATSLPAQVNYRDDVRSVLRDHCASCHNANRMQSGLDLSSYNGVLAGSSSGEVVSKGDPDDSYLYLVTAHEEEPTMPPGPEMIPNEDLEVLRLWIEQGLPETADDVADGVTDPAPTEGVESESNPESALAKGMARVSVKATEPHPPGPVVALAASASQGLIAVGDQSQVVLFNSEDATIAGVLPFPEGEVQTLRFSADGQFLLAAGGVHSEYGSVVLWSIDPLQRVWTGGDEYDVVIAADLSPDRARVILGGPERILKVISTSSGEVLYTLDKHTDWGLDACFSPDGLLFASSDRDGGLYIWETESGALLHSLRGHTDAVPRIGWQSGGDVCISASEDGTVRRWDMHTGQQIGRWAAHEEGVLQLAVLEDDSLVTIGRDRRVKHWSASGNTISESEPRSALPTSVASLGVAKIVLGDFRGRVVIDSEEDSSSERDLFWPTASQANLLASSITEGNVNFPTIEKPGTMLLASLEETATTFGSADEKVSERAGDLEARLRAYSMQTTELIASSMELREEAAEIEKQIELLASSCSTGADRLEAVRMKQEEVSKQIEALREASDSLAHVAEATDDDAAPKEVGVVRLSQAARQIIKVALSQLQIEQELLIQELSTLESQLTDQAIVAQENSARADIESLQHRLSSIDRKLQDMEAKHGRL